MAELESQTPRRRPVSRPTIGVMIDHVDDDFQRELWAGLEDGAREAGASVASFLGGSLDPDSPCARGRNAIFRLIGPESMDGLVVVSTVMASHIGNERLDEFCQRYRPLPMVSLGFPLASMPSIVADGQHGLRDLLEHLLGEHGRRRFLFVGGTAQNADAVERERIFRETLARHEIPVDPRLVQRADFSPARAYAVVREALAQGLAFDAVVSVNDQMAYAVLEALDDAGIRAPEDVSVTGFDDVPGAARLSLPLTTVRQPLREMAREAMQVVVSIVRGDPAPPIGRHQPQVVLRRSCGCFSEAVKRAGEPLREAAGGGAEAPVDAILAELRAARSDTLRACGTGAIQELVDALLAEVGAEDPQRRFVQRLDTWLRASLGARASEDGWDELVTLLRRHLGRLATGAEERHRAESLLQQARVLVKEAFRQQQWRAHASLARKTLTVQFVVDELIGSFDVPTLLDNMARELPRIGIRRCFLAVHAPDRPYREARLLLAYDEHGRVPIGKEGIAYPARHLLPDGILERLDRFNVIWQPLLLGDEEIGFIGLDFNPLEEISSLALAEQIRSALKASQMMQEISEKDRLLSNLDRMKNDFIANVTHDFRSLVAIILNSSFLGMEADGGDLPNLRDLFGMVHEASLKLKVAIDRLLDLARMDERGLVLNIRKLRPRKFLADLAAFYRPVLSVSGIALKEEFPAREVDDLFTDADKVEQIMHNLISNAAKFVQRGKGTVTLSLADRGRSVEIAVTDDGAGIAPEQLRSLFVRFQQRDPAARQWSGSTGIGLAFVKELATYLGGSIAAHSEGRGKGARFVLTLAKGSEQFAEIEVGEESEISVHASMVRDEFRQILESSLREKTRAGEPTAG
jgi:DNA-binding LacI/PurR family transcriptional regulator/signal transduction histidine kinase